MDDLISRQAAIEYFMTNTNWYDEDGYEIHDAEDKRALLKSYFDGIPSVQSDITDAQAIDHLQSTGWMQNHDYEMYMMGIRDGLADDSNSYDALIPTNQNVVKWIKHERAEEVEGFLISNYECSYCHSWERKKSYYCPYCGKKMEGSND